MHGNDMIKKGYLTSLIFSLSFVFIVGGVISALLLYMDLYKPLDTHYSAVISIISELKDTLMTRTVKITAFFSFITVIGLFLLGIIYTHRIAGPLHRVKAVARSIKNGNLHSTIHFRDKDVIHTFAESLNLVSSSYKQRIEELASETGRLKTVLAELHVQSPDTEEDRKKKLDDISDADARIRDLFDRMKL